MYLYIVFKILWLSERGWNKVYSLTLKSSALISHVWSKHINSDSSCNFSLIEFHANVKAQIPVNYSK